VPPDGSISSNFFCLFLEIFFSFLPVISSSSAEILRLANNPVFPEGNNSAH